MGSNGVAPADSALLRLVVEDAARRYVAHRHERVEAFCARHFSVKGAWRINRKAWGHDLWRAPANALWAIPYLLSHAAAGAAQGLGWTRTADRLGKLPPGFKTAVASELEWLIYTELLELPLAQPDRTSLRDALLETILAHEGVAGLLLPELRELDELRGREPVREKLERFFVTYTASRNAAADLAGSLLNLATGAAAFQTFTPGSFTLGSAAAAALAQQIAIANFVLGPTLGSLYYSLFPAAASTGLIAGTVGGVLATLGVLVAFTGIVTDPVQQALGLHERRLRKLLDALKSSLVGEGADFRLRDAYVARVFDVIDVVRSAVQMVRR